MSANTVTVAASAASATNTASLAATITAASIRAAASIAASIAQRSHQWHSNAISMPIRAALLAAFPTTSCRTVEVL